MEIGNYQRRILPPATHNFPIRQSVMSEYQFDAVNRSHIQTLGDNISNIELLVQSFSAWGSHDPASSFGHFLGQKS